MGDWGLLRDEAVPAERSTLVTNRIWGNGAGFATLPAMIEQRLVIAIDGPAASGKSTTARYLADRLGYTYIDTGAMYRAVTYAALRAGIDPANRDRVEQLAGELHIELRRESDGSLHTYLDGVDVSAEIRTTDVTANVSLVSSYSGVRTPVVDQQRRMGESGGVVLDGRDIGTVVFPNADIKVFMIADLGARAERRKAELDRLGSRIDLDALMSDISERDRRDSTRDLSPLKRADDAVLIDTSGLTIEQQVDAVFDLVRTKQEAVR